MHGPLNVKLDNKEYRFYEMQNKPSDTFLQVAIEPVKNYFRQIWRHTPIRYAVLCPHISSKLCPSIYIYLAHYLQAFM
jgi:hypothetical protein